MPSKPFTREQKQILESNSNTFKVTNYTLSLTVSAKQKVIELYNRGYSIRKIVAELGYDYDLIGKGRAEGFITHSLSQAQSAEGLREGYTRKRNRLSEKDLENLSSNPESFRRLINEISYLRREVEFLKKISQFKDMKKRDELL